MNDNTVESTLFVDIWGCYSMNTMAYTLQERRDIINGKMIQSLTSLISAPELMGITHALNGESIQNLASFNAQFDFEFPINGDLIARLV